MPGRTDFILAAGHFIGTAIFNEVAHIYEEFEKSLRSVNAMVTVYFSRIKGLIHVEICLKK